MPVRRSPARAAPPAAAPLLTVSTARARPGSRRGRGKPSSVFRHRNPEPDDGRSDLAGFITGQGLRSGFACKATRRGRYGFPAAPQPASRPLALNRSGDGRRQMLLT